MQSVQLGYFEYLLLLGFLRLPMPLALGANPTENSDRRDLSAALAAASESLLARDLVTALPTPEGPAKMEPGLERLVRTSALAEHLIVASSAVGQQRQTWHYGFMGDTVVIHSSPHPRVHRLELSSTPEDVVEHLCAAIKPHDAPGASRVMPLVDAGLLGRALELLEQQQWQSAIDTLLDANIPEEVAANVRRSLGAEPARYALVGLSKWRGTRPTATTALIMRGAEQTWYLEDSAEQEGVIAVATAAGPVVASRLQHFVSSLVAQM